MALGVCLYGSCRRVREFYLMFQLGDAARKPNQVAKGREEMKVLTKQRMEARHRPALSLPGEGLGVAAVLEEQLGPCPLRHTSGRGQLIYPPVTTPLPSQGKVLVWPATWATC